MLFLMLWSYKSSITRTLWEQLLANIWSILILNNFLLFIYKIYFITEIIFPGILVLKMNACIFGIKKKFPDVENISTLQLEEWVNLADGDNSSVIILDTREKEEYDISHLKSARHILPSITDNELQTQILNLVKQCKNFQDITSVSQVEENISQEEEKRDNGKCKIVAYCSLGYRSSEIIRRINTILKKDNLTLAVDAYNLEGSIFKWANENRLIVGKNDKKTEFVHPYNLAFGTFLMSHLRKYPS